MGGGAVFGEGWVEWIGDGVEGAVGGVCVGEGEEFEEV